MRLAVAVWDGRISPVFDVATKLQLLDVEAGELVRTWEISLIESDPVQRAGEIARLGVDRLVCGAISTEFDAALATQGVDVVAFVSGRAGDVVFACMAGRLPSAAFSMPGCRGRAGGGRFGAGRRGRHAGPGGR